MFDIAPEPTTKRTFVQVDQLEERTHRAIRQGWFRLGSRMRQNLQQELLKKNKRGVVYTRRIKGGARRRHRASAPGQTPANRTGNYRKNVGYQLRGWEQMEFGVRNGAPYAKFLEEGTKNMSPRPGIGNTVRATARDARSFFDSSLDSELNAK